MKLLFKKALSFALSVVLVITMVFSSASIFNSIAGTLASQYTIYPYLDMGKSTFTDEEKILDAFEYYSEIDSLGRCGVAFANICREIMPTEKKSSIGMVKPSGWQTPQNKYDFVDGQYLYNRCHLIAFELAGENANEKNLITGTRYMNVSGMLPFENMVADHVKATNHHVLYKSTPIFEGNNLLCDGVQIEAYCVEEHGGSIDFNVFCYNVQPGVNIDYATGENWLCDNSTVMADQPGIKVEVQNIEKTANYGDDQTYVLNTNTKKIHYPSCSSVKKMKDSNKKVVSDTVASLNAQGYVPCKICNPR